MKVHEIKCIETKKTFNEQSAVLMYTTDGTKRNKEEKLWLWPSNILFT